MNRSTIALAICMMFSGFAASDAAAKGPPTGGGETSAVNNLSYPAVFPSTGVTLSGTEGQWSFGGALGNGMSYGCAKPETIGTTTYPNTSCVTAEGVYMDAPACLAGPCASYKVEPIYWQKNASNVWQAGSFGPEAGVQTATHLDWGDNLESVSWSASSIIRVETGPFATLAEADAQTGFQMWHVSGQGTTELWGAHAASATQPYLYQSTYAFIVTPTARLNMAKLESGASTCPTSYDEDPPYEQPTWDGKSWTGTFPLRDIPYTAELAISGKFVYGYVWNLRKDPMPTGAASKAGWWRLTFYSPQVILDDAALLEPPTLPAAAPAALAALAAAAEDEGEDGEGDTGPLYRPVIDEANNLTYIDICITAAKGGGGRR